MKQNQPATRSHARRPQSSSSVVRPRNRLLAVLPIDDYRRLSPHLTTIPLRVKHVLRRRDTPITHVFFPNGGVCSIIAVVAAGAMVECDTVGMEGVVGIEAFLSEKAVSFGETIVQVPGPDAMVLPVGEFRRELARHGALYDLVARYTEALMAQLMQQSVCNALHDVQHRCARWLLMTHDRMQQQDFRLSHEFLALMLGVQRPTVSVVAGCLQQAGIIRYTHGHLTVLDRRRLEEASCECYRLVRHRFDRLLT